MNDLIERQAVIDAITASINQYGGRYTAEQLNMWGLFVQMIQELPSAQPMWKKGEWTIEDCHAATYRYCCSNCKAHHRARYGFCPSCGAEMEKRD